MIIYSVGMPLTEDVVVCVKACAYDLHVVGDSIFMMGSWEDQFPLYDIVLMKPHVIAVFLVEDEVGYVGVRA